MRKAVRGPALVVVGMLLLQAAWILTMPPFRGVDEFDHAFRAAAVARGQWVAGEPATDGRGQLVIVPGSLVEAAHDQCASLDYTGADNCSPVRELPDGEVEVASAASSYHPAFYWVIGTAALPFDGAGALYAMRIGTALLSVLFIGLAAWAVAKLPGRWPTTGLVLAITPVFVYSTTVAAPNGVEMSAGLALWATLLALVDGRDKRTETRLLLGAILSAVVLGSLRVLGPVFIVMIVATVAALDWGAVRDVISRQRRLVLAGCALIGASVLGQMLWMFDTVAREVGGDVVAESPKTFNSVNIIVWPLQTIAAFPSRNQAGAAVIYPVVLILVGALLAAAWRRGSSRARVVMVASLTVTLVFPFVFTLATLGSIGNIWQGRYLLPYAVGFLLLAGYTLGSLRTQVGPAPRVLYPAAAFYGVAVAACTIKVRKDELTDNPASIGDPSWHAPSPVLLAILTVGATLLMVRAVSDSRGEHGVAFRLFKPIHARLLGTRVARLIWMVPGAHMFYRWLMPRLRPPSVVVDDHTLYLDAMDSLLLSVNGNYEPFEQELFGRCIRPGDTVLDIGAHIGLYTLLAARAVGGAGRVIAFEPSEDNYALLQRNVELNGYDNVVTVRAAVADVSGRGELALSADNTGDNTLVAPGSSGVRTRSVETLTVDEYVGPERVDVVKMDIQGAEPAALAGAANTLAANDELVLFTELSPAHLTEWGGAVSLITSLSDAGFSFYEIAEAEGGVVRRDADVLIHRAAASTADYWNLVCVKGARGHELLEPFAVARGDAPESTRGPAWRS